MEVRITKGFVRRAATGKRGKPAFLLLLVVDGELPAGFDDESVIAGRIVFDVATAALNVVASAKTDQFVGYRADQIITSL